MKVLIVAAGEPPSQELFLKHYKWCDYSIAADGGLAVFGDRLPDWIVGDMDSVSAELPEKYIKAGVKVIKAEVEKNETDSMLALNQALALGATKIVFLGGTGGRLDHALSNLALLKRAYQNGVQLTLEDDRQHIAIGTGTFEIEGREGQTVSIIPVDEFARVTARGLYYPLDDLLLANSDTRGISNILTSAKASIRTKEFVFILKIKQGF